jgi:hypothetical protein
MNVNAVKKRKSNYSIVSIFSFFTNGLLIFSDIHEGLFSGALTISFHPLKTCTFFVPRSLSRIISGRVLVPVPRFAALSAACLGCFPVKTPCSLPSSSRKTKFLCSVSVSVIVSPVVDWFY